MINFSVGPVQMEEEIRKLGSEEIPYFRTPEFSELMKENETLMKQFFRAGIEDRALFLTGSGTAAMEAAIINLFTPSDRVLIVNGGSFGARFVKICRIHRIPYTEIKLEIGKRLTKQDLEPYEQCKESGYTGLLVNVHETSTGVHYDMDLISHFCKKNKLYLIVDAISSFLADEFYMEKWGVDLVLTGSQKALALPPGLSILVLNQKAVKRVETNKVESLYFDLKDYLKDGERGQTPYTPAVGILIQLNRRLKKIAEKGMDSEQNRIHELALDFRKRIQGLPFEICSDSLSNAETPLHPTGRQADGSPVSAQRIFEVLKDEYGIFICPNGGELKEKLFRVGHIGNLTIEDNKKLVDAWKDMQNRGML